MQNTIKSAENITDVGQRPKTQFKDREKYHLARSIPQQLQTRQVFVRSCMSQPHQPGRKAELRRDRCDRARVGADLQWVDEAIDEANERGRIVLAHRQRVSAARL